MPRSAQQLRDDALAIWQAGVDAVRPENLMPQVLAAEAGRLQLGNERLDLESVGRIVVVGAGKAGAGMVRAVEAALGDELLRQHRVTGIVNVPADCVGPTKAVELVAARPPGVNEPTAEGVAATQRICALVATLSAPDICLCLISGGGSALLEHPLPGFPLTALATLTRELSARGAAIDQLNAVRRELSAVKGGGLARLCNAGRLTTFVLSDVLGDDLATIASGPTVLAPAEPDRALEVLAKFQLTETAEGQLAIEVLRQLTPGDRATPQTEVTNLVIGNNATAVDAAGIEAERRGYRHAMTSATQPEGPAEEVAAHLVQMTDSMGPPPGPDCLISGGEPTVQLAPADERGKGGRNQQLALAALVGRQDWGGAALLSGGTDGEDGPTDAAGALVDAVVAERAMALGLDPQEFLGRNDAYHFFEATDGLIRTGPTNTNVCDLRIVTVA